MPMLAELVEVVIGVDTHADSHSAAVLDARTGGVLARATVSTDPDGYAELVTLAEAHSGLRAWALEGAGGYGAGLARHLADGEELVVELDRPVRARRHGGAKSDTIDAERAAREALGRTRLAQPKTGPARAAVAMHLTARRAAVEAASTAQRQLRALVITAPEPVRARFRGQSTTAMVTTATRLRPATTSGDVEVREALSVLRTLARRITFLTEEADEHERTSERWSDPGALTCCRSAASARSWPAPCWRRGPTRAGSATMRPSPCSPVSPRSPPLRARPPATGSTAAATAS